MAIRRIAILGATGSIGTSALSVVDTHRDRLQVVGLAAGNNVPVFAEQVRKYAPRAVALASERGLTALRGLIDLPPIAASGADGLIAVATHPDVDILLCASSGTTALEAVLAAIECGKTIALANKEVLVMAGGLVTEAARGRASRDVRRLILTASGGPFRGRSRDSLSQVTAADALKHPTWQMGQKITIDSATLMNKGLEVIEAHWLFGVPASKIDVVVHPQSVVHSMVEFLDGSVIAQLGITDMRLPIQYAFSFPDRWDAPVPFLDLAQMGALTFEQPAREDFPCLDLAYRALEADRSLPIVLNAANEVAVASFLEGRLRFTAIPEVIVRTMDAHHAGPAEALRDVRRIDTWARAHADEAVRELQST